MNFGLTVYPAPVSCLRRGDYWQLRVWFQRCHIWLLYVLVILRLCLQYLQHAIFHDSTLFMKQSLGFLACSLRFFPSRFLLAKLKY